MLKPQPPLGTAKEERIACCNAFSEARTKAGDWVEYEYHDQPLSVLDQTPEKRARIIEETKPKTELALRFRMFRPHKEKVLLNLDKARAEWDKARAEWDEARMEWDEARAELGKAQAELGKAQAELGKAQTEWDKARAEWNKAVRDTFPSLQEEHNRLHPESPWNDVSLF